MKSPQTMRKIAVGTRGAAMAEYGLLLALVVLASLAAVAGMGQNVTRWFDQISTKLENPVGEGSGMTFVYAAYVPPASYKDGYGYLGADPAADGWLIGTTYPDTLNSKGHTGVLGLEGDDYITGGSTDEILMPGPGNDEVHGGGGSDLYVYEAGGGHDVFIDTSGASDQIDLRDFTSANVPMSRHSTTDELRLELGGGSLTLPGMWGSGSLTFEAYSFADQTFDTRGFRDLMVHAMKQSGEVHGTRLEETHRHAASDPGYTLFEMTTGRGGPLDHLAFTDLNADELVFDNVNINTARVTTPDGDSITLNYQHYGVGDEYGIAGMSFANGDRFNRQDIRNRAVSDQIARGDAEVIGTLQPDTFTHKRGVGSYRINDGWNNFDDRLRLPGLRADDVKMEKVQNDAILRTIDGDVITIDDHEYADHSRMDYFEFDDITLDVTEMDEKYAADERAEGRMHGETDENDSYSFTSGESSVTIYDSGRNAGFHDILTFTDLDRADLTFARDGRDLVITTPSGAQVRTDQQFLNDYYGVEEIRFQNDSPMLLSEINAIS